MNIVTFTKISLPHGWMSNMSRHSVQHGGHFWLTAEHLFQALRFDEHSLVRAAIRHQRSPMVAKMCAKNHRHDWVVKPRTDEDLQLMRLVLRLKWEQHLYVRQRLRETGDAELVEDVTRRPTDASLFWGVAHPHEEQLRRGENWLGRLWMELRFNVRTYQMDLQSHEEAHGVRDK